MLGANIQLQDMRGYFRKVCMITQALAAVLNKCTSTEGLMRKCCSIRLLYEVLLSAVLDL